MTAGARSQPPDLPNFVYRSWLGGGGFADVFLYDQLRPARQVAVKVLRLASLDAADLSAFDDEANLMAKVSAHSYIVDIYGADVAPDGRPFLVMEYYARPNFAQRTRGAGLAVQEVLRVGVRVASAVETAHQAGILHRDIKPANILVNDYDRPGLTDFGIAGARDGSTLAESQGVTVAYAPPEVLADDSVQGDERGDVYSLAATLYALLAGRAPFEVARGDNTAQALLQRTLNAAVPGIERPDVPRSLELLLAQAMAKDPAHRPASAAALGRALQGIERELHLAPTEFELIGAEEPPAAPAGDEDVADSTRARRIQVVRPTAPLFPSAPISQVPDGLTQQRGASEPPVVPASSVPAAPAAAHTVARPGAAAPTTDPGTSPEARAAPPDRRHLLAMAAGAAAVVAMAVGILLTAGGGDGGVTTTTTTSEPASELIIDDPPAAPANVTATRVGTDVTVVWEPGDGVVADTFTIRRTDQVDEALQARRVDGSPVVVPGVGPSEAPCFIVQANVTGGQSSESAEVCAA